MYALWALGSISAGMRLSGQLEDPRLAGALLWPSAAEEDPAKLELKRLQASVVPGFKVGGGVAGCWLGPHCQLLMPQIRQLGARTTASLGGADSCRPLPRLLLKLQRSLMCRPQRCGSAVPGKQPSGMPVSMPSWPCHLLHLLHLPNRCP